LFSGASDTPDRSFFSRLVKWRWVENVGSFFGRDGMSSSGPEFVEKSAYRFLSSHRESGRLLAGERRAIRPVAVCRYLISQGLGITSTRLGIGLIPSWLLPGSTPSAARPGQRQVRPEMLALQLSLAAVGR
jgi:hypothetical protein